LVQIQETPHGATPGRPPRKLVAIAALSGFLMMTTAHAQAPLGWIELKPVPGRNLVQIIGRALSTEPVSAAFTLSIRRRNGGNLSDTKQSGRFNLGANEEAVLSSTSINVETGDDLTIELKILEGDKEVSSTVISSKGAGGGQKI
jgi:hypothetical protein